MQPSVCFIFTSYLITLQPTPLRPLNLFWKNQFQNGDINSWASASRSRAVGSDPSGWSRGSPGFLLMLPPQAGTSRCCLDFLFPSPATGGPTSSTLPPSLHPHAGRQVGWVLFCSHSSGAFMRRRAAWNDFGHRFFYLFIFLTTAWDHGTQSFHLLCSCRVGRNYCQVLLHFLPGRSLENLSWKKDTTCCYLISFLVSVRAHGFTSSGRICWIQSISSLLKIYSSSSQNEETAGVPADANSSCEASHNNSVTTSHSRAADEFLSSGFLLLFFCLCVLWPHLPAQQYARKHSAVVFFFKALTQSVSEGMNSSCLEIPQSYVVKCPGFVHGSSRAALLQKKKQKKNKLIKLGMSQFANAKEMSTQRPAHKHLKHTKSKEHTTQTKHTACSTAKIIIEVYSEFSNAFSQCTCHNN